MRLKARNSTIEALAAGCLLACLAACAGNAGRRADADALQPPPPAGLDGFSSPAQLRAASDFEAVNVDSIGTDFNPSVDPLRVVSDGEQAARFDVSSLDGTLAGSAFAGYFFKAPAFDRTPLIELNVDDYPAFKDSLYFGLSNWQSDTWDWVRAGDAAEIAFNPLTHMDANGLLFLIVLLAHPADEDMLLRRVWMPFCVDWCRSIGGSGSDVLEKVIVGADGGIYACGFTRSFSAGRDRMIAKYNQRGELEWVKWLEDPDGSHIYQTGTAADQFVAHPDGGVVGIAHRSGALIEDVYLPAAFTLFHVEGDGTLDFQTHIGSSAACKPGALGLANTGQYVHVGVDVVPSGPGFREEPRLFIFAPDGSLEASPRLEHPDATDATTWDFQPVCVPPAGATFALGVNYVTVSDVPKGRLTVTLGDPVTAEVTGEYNGPDFGNGDVASFYVDAYSHPELGMVYAPWYSRVNGAGDSLWSSTVLVGTDDGCFFPVLDSDGNVIYPGRTNLANGSSPYIGVLDPSGGVQGIYLWDAPGQARSVAVDGHRCIYGGFCSINAGILTGLVQDNRGAWEDRTDETEVVDDGYLLFANEYIKAINASYDTEIPLAGISQLFANNGAFFPDSGGGGDDMAVSKLDKYSQ